MGLENVAYSHPGGELPVPKGWRRLFLRRYVVCLLAFFGFFNVYLMRINVSVSVIAMNKEYPVTMPNGTIAHIKYFNWTSAEKGTFLSAFFYGYICTQIYGGILAARYGGCRVFAAGIFFTACLTFITPFVAPYGMYMLIAVRVVEGLFEGVTYPCIQAVWSRWAPPQERNRLASIAYSGSSVGTVIGFPACSFLADYFGWQYTFYVPGVTGILWTLIWFIFVYDRPENDPRITNQELEYLKQTLGNTKHGKIVHPWKKFFTSMPVWAIIVAHFCSNWIGYTLLTLLPTYVNETLHFDVQAAGFISALPYIVNLIVLQIVGVYSDKLNNKKILTTTRIRKIFNCGSCVGQAVCLMLAAIVNSATLAIFFITLTVGLDSVSFAAFGVNHLDLAPRHASVLFGISNTFGTISGILSPTIGGFIIKHKSKSEWRLVFGLSCIILLVEGVFYGIFASAELQPWATNKEYQSVIVKNSKTTNKQKSSINGGIETK